MVIIAINSISLQCYIYIHPWVRSCIRNVFLVITIIVYYIPYIYTNLGMILNECIIDTITITHFFLIIDTTHRYKESFFFLYIDDTTSKVF